MSVKRISVDIETLSVREDAACIAIGASLIGSSLSFVSYMDIGLVPGHRMPETIEFWHKQDLVLKEKVWGGRDNPIITCKEFVIWYRSINPDEIWANPPQFDLVIMRYLLRECKVEVPWHFTEERDFRTLKNLAKERKINYQSAYTGHIKHNPLSDAICQGKAIEIILGETIMEQLYECSFYDLSADISKFHQSHGGNRGKLSHHACRLLREVIELCVASGASEEQIWEAVAAEVGKANVRNEFVRDGTPHHSTKIDEEIGDVGILYMLLSDYARVDALASIDHKLSICRQRKWEVDEHGVLWRPGTRI